MCNIIRKHKLSKLVAVEYTDNEKDIINHLITNLSNLNSSGNGIDFKYKNNLNKTILYHNNNKFIKYDEIVVDYTLIWKPLINKNVSYTYMRTLLVYFLNILVFNNDIKVEKDQISFGTLSLFDC